jgi:hypothetical protein
MLRELLAEVGKDARKDYRLRMSHKPGIDTVRI